MTVFERIEKFLIERRGWKFCDDCLSRALEITPRQHVQHKTSELAHKPGFMRHHDKCASCGSTNKLVVGAKKIEAAVSVAR